MENHDHKSYVLPNGWNLMIIPSLLWVFFRIWSVGFVFGTCGVISNWLVVWNMTFIFPYIENNHPNWLSYFQRGRYTTNQETMAEWQLKTWEKWKDVEKHRESLKDQLDKKNSFMVMTLNFFAGDQGKSMLGRGNQHWDVWRLNQMRFRNQRLKYLKM